MEVRRATRADLDLVMEAGYLFDGPPDRARTVELLDDARHHLFLALTTGKAAGFLSAVDYIHPDKPRSLWINELGVHEAARRRGIATRLVASALTHARAIGCADIWVLADPTTEALSFYASLNWSREGDHIAMFTKVLA